MRRNLNRNPFDLQEGKEIADCGFGLGVCVSGAGDGYLELRIADRELRKLGVGVYSFEGPDSQFAIRNSKFAIISICERVLEQAASF